MSAIGNIQQQVADALSANPFFANITVYTEKAATIFDSMEKALSAETAVGGKAGAFVMVLTPDANANWPEVGRPFFDNIKIHVQVTINPDVAADPTIGIGVTDLDICEAVCNTLHQIALPGANSPLVVDVPTITLMDKGDNHTTRLCRFKCMGGLRTLPGQLPTPTITETSGQITLACATPGAAIFYTLDGSNASPLNGILYTAPFTPGTGLNLTARAWLAGYLASQPANTTT